MADWIKEKQERIEKARGPFERLCMPMMGVDNGGVWDGNRLPVFERVKAALWALREWRQVNNQQQRSEDEAALAVRVVADSMASEIQGAASGEQDAATIAWVVAGLRCPRRPFCRGCDSCFSVDAPHRADVQFVVTAPNPGGQA